MDLVTPTATRLQEWRHEGDSHNKLHEQYQERGSSVAGQNRRTVGRILSKMTAPKSTLVRNKWRPTKAIAIAGVPEPKQENCPKEPSKRTVPEIPRANSEMR
jgi:hypothetical protein